MRWSLAEGPAGGLVPGSLSPAQPLSALCSDPACCLTRAPPAGWVSLAHAPAPALVSAVPGRALQRLRSFMLRLAKVGLCFPARISPVMRPGWSTTWMRPTALSWRATFSSEPAMPSRPGTGNWFSCCLPPPPHHAWALPCACASRSCRLSPSRPEGLCGPRESGGHFACPLPMAEALFIPSFPMRKG